LLFALRAIGNEPTFRRIPHIFSKKQTGFGLGWASVIAACGFFIIPKVFGEQIQLGRPQYALYGFAISYVICPGLNWRHDDRKEYGIDS